MEDWNLSIFLTRKEEEKTARENTGINHGSHTVELPLEAKQQRRICMMGRIFSDTWDVPLSSGSNIDMSQHFAAASVKTLKHTGVGKKRETPVNPGELGESGRERIRMQHAERRTCRSGRMLLLLLLLLRSSMTKQHLQNTRALSLCAR